MEVHFGGFWAPGLLTILLQGGLKLESYVAESYVNFGSILGHLRGTPPPPQPRADRDSYLQTINRDDRLQTEPCLTRLVTPDGVGGFIIVRTPKVPTLLYQEKVVEIPKVKVHANHNLCTLHPA